MTPFEIIAAQDRAKEFARSTPPISVWNLFPALLIETFSLLALRSDASYVRLTERLFPYRTLEEEVSDWIKKHLPDELVMADHPPDNMPAWIFDEICENIGRGKALRARYRHRLWARVKWMKRAAAFAVVSLDVWAIHSFWTFSNLGQYSTAISLLCLYFGMIGTGAVVCIFDKHWSGPV